MDFIEFYEILWVFKRSSFQPLTLVFGLLTIDRKPRPVDRSVDRRAQKCIGFSGRPFQRVCSLEIVPVDRAGDRPENLLSSSGLGRPSGRPIGSLSWGDRPSGRTTTPTVENSTIGGDRVVNRQVISDLFWTPTASFSDPYKNGSLGVGFS